MSDTATPTRPRREALLRRLFRRPLAAASIVVLALVALLTIIGPWIAPTDPNKASAYDILAGPSAEHLLGTDSVGRDVFSRLLTATQVTILGALLALVTALVIGVVAGLLAGYYRGWFDSVASWVASLLMALPGIVVLLAARSVLGPSVWLAMLIFGVLLSPAYFRLVYATVSAVRSELYVDAARVSGLSDIRIIGRHILTVVRAPIIIQSAIVAGIAIAIQSGLEFLGLGDITVPTWGSMLDEAFTSMFRSPLMILWPSLAISITCIALTLFANALRDELERAGGPRKRITARAVARAAGMSTTALPVSETGPVPALAEEDETVAKPVRHPDDAQGEVLLSVHDLSVGYAQSDGSTVPVVHGVSLDVRRGEVHGLIGESGSGKTQTALSILGLLPEGGEVTGGRIDLDGIPLAGAGESAYRGIRGRRIAYIPQEPMSNLDPSFTIGSQLVEPLRAELHLGRREAKERALALLERVGIPDPARTFSAYPFEVSGGMAQRVLIAGAVAAEPDLVIADEPTTALDVTVQAEVLELLRGLQREQGMAMLLVTHNFGVVADLCDRVTVMQQGRVVESGPVRTIFSHAEHPYTRGLLGAILDGGPARSPWTAREGARS